ncbi:MAG TPA: AtpZ/AtpI family protein [Candidatus Saccharimonadales bacterium]|nr:AtpZ/AtpI family protein [Candidatus Saccharimonadales bacterium]
MKQAADSPTTPSGSGTFGAGVIALTFLDTTWRIAVPVVGATLAGIYADRHLHTKPWLTLLSVVLGFALAALLVKSQIASVQKAEERKK